jgi:hypothetical protein
MGWEPGRMACFLTLVLREDDIKTDPMIFAGEYFIALLQKNIRLATRDT